MLSWVNYGEELAYWVAEVQPLLEQAGLRQPFAPAYQASAFSGLC